MRYIILVKATVATESGDIPSHELMGEVARYTGELAKAGALYDATGLKPTSSGWRVRYREEREMIPGPFPASPDIIAGSTVIRVDSRGDAIEWSMRYPNPAGVGAAEIEVREFFELEDFEEGPELTESSGEFIFEPATEAELRGLSGIHQVSAVRWQDS